VVVGGVEKVLRLSGADTFRIVADRLHDRAHTDPFTVEGITYYPLPCSVGQTPHGEMTGLSAADMIRARGLTDLHVLDLCCGLGLVGYTLLAAAGGGAVRRLSFADINFFNLTSVQKTMKNSVAPKFPAVEMETFLSDVLKHVPPRRQFDLIVSNPPHFDHAAFSDSDDLNPAVLGTFDPGWAFHKDFYETAHEYLSETGEIWFLENRYAPDVEQTLADLVKQNERLEYVESFDDKRDPMVFWMISRNASI
jgi:methylase of polypeptide subunit release factors